MGWFQKTENRVVDPFCRSFICISPLIRKRKVKWSEMVGLSELPEHGIVRARVRMIESRRWSQPDVNKIPWNFSGRFLEAQILSYYKKLSPHLVDKLISCQLSVWEVLIASSKRTLRAYRTWCLWKPLNIYIYPDFVPFESQNWKRTCHLRMKFQISTVVQLCLCKCPTFLASP